MATTGSDTRLRPEEAATLALKSFFSNLATRADNRTALGFPIFQDSAIRIAEYRGGLPMLTTDDRYLVGPLPGIAGAWVMSGCCVGGLSASPALGEALAEWIVDGTSEIDLSEISTARFAGREIDEAELRERCRRAYATHYRADRD